MKSGKFVVDFRARPPTPEFLSYFNPKHVEFVGRRLGLKQLPKSFLRNSVEDWFDEARAGGVDWLVVLGRNAPAGAGAPLSAIPNEHIADLVRQHPGELVGIAGIDVGGEFGDPVEQTLRAADLGLRAIHISPTRSALKTHADDRRLYPLYETCIELGLPVIYMTGPFAGPNIEDTHPKHFQAVAADFPKLDVVCGHGCWPYVAEALGVAFKHPNVHLAPDAYIFMPGGEQYVQAANGFLQNQLLYGSAYPVGGLDWTVEAFLRLPLRDSALEAALGLNASRLLKLDLASPMAETSQEAD